MKQFMICISILLISITAYAGDAFDLEATGDHSVWVIVNDIKGNFAEDTGLKLNLLPELAIIGKGCEKGINEAKQGEPSRQFGLVCCVINPKMVKDNNLKQYPFAREPLTIIVNRDNPVKGLSMAQVRDIFSGKITNWKDVGGLDEKIVVLTQLHCQIHTPNWHLIFSDPGKFTKNRMDIKTQPEMAKTVADYRQAIGHLEMTSVRESNEDLKVLPIDGYAPTSENVRKGLYPLYATLSLLTMGEAQGNVVKFYHYLQTSPKVKEAMKKYGMAQVKE